MDLGIAGETALITGGTQGLAYNAAQHLGEAGVNVVLNGRNEASGATAIAGLGDTARFVAGDVSDPKERARIFEEASADGPVTILINNAGGPPTGDFQDQSLDAWRAALETNMLAGIDFAQRCLTAMEAAGFGRILNITSFVVREPYPQMALANSVRIGLHGAMASLAQEVAAKGITVNAILPGLMDTGALKRVFRAQSERDGISEDEVKVRMAASVPTGRLGTAEDFGPACAFLCSRHAGYITGQSLTVDGGLVKAVM